MKRWLPIFLILLAGLLGAIWLSRPEFPAPPLAGGTRLSSNQLARLRLSGGGHHALIIAEDGSLWSLGHQNAGAALGLGKISRGVVRPQQVGTNSDWLEISAGYSHSLGLRRDGSLWAWGSNPSGVLGDGTTETRFEPVRVGTENDWKEIGTGLHHSLGLKSNGTVWAWGANSIGQLGQPYQSGGSNMSFVPVQVGRDADWKTIAVCSLLNAAVKKDGSLWTWGDAGLAAIGVFNASNHYAPVRIGSDNDWAAVAAGYYHTVALKRDGSLWHWGRNSHLLGGIPAKDPNTLRRFETNHQWAAVFSGGYHNLALDTNGRLWQLGDGRFGASRLQEIPGTWLRASGGAEFSLALADDGTVWHWGPILGARRPPGTLKRTAGHLLDMAGIQNSLRNEVTLSREQPQLIFARPAGTGPR